MQRIICQLTVVPLPIYHKLKHLKCN